MNMKGRNRFIAVFLAALAASALFACGAADDDRKLYEGGAAPAAAAVGMDTCATCHLGMVEEWLATPHANMNPNNTSDLSFVGSPAIGDLTPGACTNCHDLNTESANMMAGVTGDVPRPVVGCEACHGGGSNHNGSGPIGPYAQAGSAPAILQTTGLTTISVTASTKTFTRAAGDFIADGFAFADTITVSGFTNVANNGTFTLTSMTATTLVVTATTLVNEAGTGDELITSGPVTITRSSQFNTCTTCHELLSAGTGGSATPAHSATAPTGSQYFTTDTHYATPRASTGLIAVNGYVMDYSSDMVCSDCHRLHKPTSINGDWAQSAKADRTRSGQDPQGYFSAAWSRSNWTCDGTVSSLPACESTTTPGVFSDNRRCQRCHTTTGFKKYADAIRSGDQTTIDGMVGGTIAALPVTSQFKPEMLKCNGCHTDNKGTLRNPGRVTARYDVVINYPTSADPLDTYATVSHTYPDVAESNVCITCHVGRESGDSIKQLNEQVSIGMPTVNFNDLGFQNSHYLTGGGTIFTVTGYTFGGRSYDNPSSYMHNRIGTDNFKNTGDKGPCVGCHMSRPNKNGNHIYLPISRFNRVRYNAGTVTVTAGNATVNGIGTFWAAAGIDPATDTFRAPDGRVYQIDGGTPITNTSFALTSLYRGTTVAAPGQNYVIAKDGLRVTGIASEACFNCHTYSSITLVDQLNEERELFEEALLSLNQVLDKAGFCFIESNPYFFKRRYNTGTISDISVLANEVTVTGVGTMWTTAGIDTASDGTPTTYDKFKAYDGNAYDIQSVVDDTHLKLRSPYLGTFVPGTSYAIAIPGSTNIVVDWATDPLNDTTGNTWGKNNMGAAFNLNLFEHDPGAYVHNRMYVKRLIYDSIDWADNQTMDFSVGQTLSALTTEPYKAGAIAYILPNGVITGFAAERP